MRYYILGIDVGTGSTKAVAMAGDGTVIGTAQHHYAVSRPEPGFSEQDPEVIWEAFVQCIRDVVSEVGGAPLAVSLSSAMHSLILVDDTGRPLCPMITWADVRSADVAGRIRSSAEGELIYRTTGTPLHPMSPLCKLVWLRENKPGLFDQAQHFIGIKEYIWHRLFNCFEVDYSVASATGVFDILELNWSAAACALAGVDPERLSTPVDTIYIRAGLNVQIAALLNIPVDTRFIIGASDGCCANLGSGVTGPGMAALTIGSSGAVRVTGTAPVYDYAGMTFNYLLRKDTFVSGGAVNNGGIAVDWLLKDFMGKTKVFTGDYQSLFATIETVPAGSEGLIFLPYLYGERAPIWDARSSGAYLNIQPGHNQAHFLRAAMEGICYALNNVLQGLEQATGRIDQLNISGGFLSSATWVQLLADVTGKKLLVLQPEDASAIGAVDLAKEVLFPGIKLPQKSDGFMIHPHQENQLTYAKIFPLFKKLSADLKDSMQALHQLDQ